MDFESIQLGLLLLMSIILFWKSMTIPWYDLLSKSFYWIIRYLRYLIIEWNDLIQGDKTQFWFHVSCKKKIIRTTYLLVLLSLSQNVFVLLTCSHFCNSFFLDFDLHSENLPRRNEDGKMELILPKTDWGS